MRRISYSGGSFVTSDSVADALLRFVAALGSTHKAEAIMLPVVMPGGEPENVQLVIGPASELVSASERSTLPEPDSSEAVAYLRGLTNALAGPHPVASPAPLNRHGDFDPDEL